jgi:hypothetical protein
VTPAETVVHRALVALPLADRTDWLAVKSAVASAIDVDRTAIGECLYDLRLAHAARLLARELTGEKTPAH